ncbi:hypothetical protein [Mucilaginibacter sp.]|uniref:hypothetical protein n=1 Tax=Mucilaginibacter sp. TaxID=1882438 RepID=UPI00262C5B9A|nr:hypothetical protein [Mucilaginibacter sp.]MDB5029389.1 hypothetical protein [Mucilaginibacter sp.]
MIFQQHSLYRKLLLLGLLVQLIAAWFSLGYNQCDEHFQVLEFCNYKLGLSPATDLPWEFAAHCRSALQPFVAYIISKALLILNLYNPFWVSFIMRLIMGIATWLLTCRVVILMLPQFTTEKGKQVYVWCSFLLWFIPYIGVRFSAENIAGLLFLTALTLLPGLLAANSYKRYFKIIVAGILLGFALMIRLQMAFAFIPLIIWIIVYAKWPLKNWLVVILSGLVAIGLAVLADKWLYGAWVFSPYNYYRVNIVQHVADNYGTSPWWYYLKLFFDYAVPPISYFLLPLFLIGLWKNPRHLFSWICIVFILGHSVIGHKEIRFLLPLIFPLIFLACQGFDLLLKQYPAKKIFRWALPILAGFNIALLSVKIFMPAHEAFAYYKFMYNFAQKQPATLVSFETSPYHILGLEINFYKPKNMNIEVVHSTHELDTILKRTNGRAVIFVDPKIDPTPFIAGYKKTKVYCLVPDWIHLFNVNNWISRSYIWTVYRLK